MTANQHPYPAHVVEAVAFGMWASMFYHDQKEARDDWLRVVANDERSDYLEHANAALQALWDASRVETIDDIHDVPESAVVRDKTGFVAVGREHAESDIDYDDYPAHVIYWGEKR